MSSSITRGASRIRGEKSYRLARRAPRVMRAPMSACFGRTAARMSLRAASSQVRYFAGGINARQTRNGSSSRERLLAGQCRSPDRERATGSTTCSAPRSSSTATRRQKIRLIRYDGYGAVDLDVCGVVHRYKSFGGGGNTPTLVDVTTLYP